MRCAEARRKLSELRLKSQEHRALDLPESTGSEFATDKELQEHLRLCPACARQAEAARVLRQDFATAGSHDLEDTIPFAALKTRVETQASLKHHSRHTESNIMSRVAFQFMKRPRLSMGVVVVVLILAASVLVPFRYNKTIGYEVAVAGVDKDLAMDQQKVKMFLDQLGMNDVVVEVSGCDTTCLLKIRDLKSAEDAQIVMEAFEQVPNVEIKQGVTAVFEAEKGNLIEFTADKIVMSRVKLRPIGEIKKLVVERLGEEPVIILSGDSTGGAATWTIDGDSATVMHNLQLATDSGSQQVELYTVQGSLAINLSKDGSLKGYTITREDGTVDTVVWLVKDGAGEVVTEEGPDSSGKEAAVELPEGFELGQNYPNPFNPTTKIDYSVPSAQRVKIDVVNIQGQVVRTLVDEVVSAGAHTVKWDARTDDGRQVATGVYFYRLVAGDVTQTKKMTYVK